jgi:hypothetical protein
MKLWTRAALFLDIIAQIIQHNNYLQVFTELDVINNLEMI